MRSWLYSDADPAQLFVVLLFIVFVILSLSRTNDVAHLLCTCPTCMSVCPLHAGNTSKLMTVGSHGFHIGQPANGPTGTQLGWSHPIVFPILEMLSLFLRWDRLGRLLGPSNTSAAKPFPWYWSLLLTAQKN